MRTTVRLSVDDGERGCSSVRCSGCWLSPSSSRRSGLRARRFAGALPYRRSAHASQPSPSRPGPLLASGRTVGAAGDVTIAGGDPSCPAGRRTPREDVLTAPVGEGPWCVAVDPTGDMPVVVGCSAIRVRRGRGLARIRRRRGTAPQFDSWPSAAHEDGVRGPRRPARTPATCRRPCSAPSTPQAGRSPLRAGETRDRGPARKPCSAPCGPGSRRARAGCPGAGEGAAVAAKPSVGARTQRFSAGRDRMSPGRPPSPSTPDIRRSGQRLTPGEGAARNVATASVARAAPARHAPRRSRCSRRGRGDPPALPVDVPLSAGVPLEHDLPD